MIEPLTDYSLKDFDITTYGDYLLNMDTAAFLGLDIAKELSMTPSTISHHMDQLKNAGLLNEEQDGSSKFYSISRNSGEQLLKTMKNLLKAK